MTVRRPIAAALFACALASPAAAQSAAASAPVAAAVPATSFSTDTPIEAVAADPAGKAVLEKDVPGLLDHPMYETFKGMSLKDVAPMSDGKITDAMLAKTQADLAAVKPR